MPPPELLLGLAPFIMPPPGLLLGLAPFIIPPPGLFEPAPGVVRKEPRQTVGSFFCAALSPVVENEGRQTTGGSSLPF